jgi:hypothetical protein
VLCTSPAAAQHEPDPSHTAPGSEPSPRERAKQLVEEGFRHFEQGDLAGACERFERSIAEHASAEGLLNAGICRDHAGDALGALEAFEAALVAAAEQPDPAVRAGYREDLPRRIAAVQPKICALTVQLPAGASALVDGQLALSPDQPVSLNAGAHRLEARAADGRSHARELSLTPGQRLHLDLRDSLAPLAPVAPPPAPTLGAVPGPGALAATPAGLDPGVVDPPSRFGAWPVALAGSAGAALLGALLAGRVSSGAMDDLDRICEPEPDPETDKRTCVGQKASDAVDRANDYALAADLLLLGGGVLAGTGLVLWLIDEADSPAATGVTQLGIDCALGCGLSAQGRF